MNQDLLERCAIELWAVGNDPKGYELTPYNDLPEEYRKYYRRLAHAVIKVYEEFYELR